MKTKHMVALWVAIIAAVSGIAGASINAIWGSGDVVNVYINGEKMTLDNQAVQEMITENGDLKEQNNEYKENMELLSSGYKDLEESSQDKEVTIAQITEENESLKSQIEGLEEENKSLRDKLREINSGNPDWEGGMVEAVEFSEVPDILYDGDHYNKYINSEQGFLVGGKKYYSGFELNTWRHMQGFVYFNLEGKYSKIKFDVGRNGNYVQDGKLLITSSDGLRKEYDLDGGVPSHHIEIDLNYKNDLTIKLICNEGEVNFGFFNIYYIL